MDLTYTPEQDAFRAEARAWLEANVPAEPLPSFDTEAGFALAPGVGAHALRRPLVGGVVAGGVRRPRRRLPPLADLRGGVLPGRRARAASTRTASSSSAPTIMEVGHRRAEGAVPPDDGVERDVWAQAWSEPDAGSDLAAIRRQACSRRRRRRGCSTARRSGRQPGRVGRLVLRHLPHRSRGGAPPRPHVHPRARSTRPASRCGRSPSSTATPGSPRSSSTTSACRSSTRSAT